MLRPTSLTLTQDFIFFFPTYPSITSLFPLYLLFSYPLPSQFQLEEIFSFNDLSVREYTKNEGLKSKNNHTHDNPSYSHLIGYQYHNMTRKSIENQDQPSLLPYFYDP